MTTKPINLFEHEAKALAAGKLGALIRVVEPQPPSVESIYQRAGIEFSIFTDHHSKPGEFRVAGPVWAVREVMGVSSKKCPAGPKWISPFGPPGTALECREEWGPSWHHAQPRCFYKVTDFDKVDWHPDFDGWQPADSMPSWAIRFRPVVGEVRCVRYLDLTEADCEKWGVTPVRYHDGRGGFVDHTAGAHRRAAQRVLTDQHTFQIQLENWWIWVAAINREEGL